MASMILNMAIQLAPYSFAILGFHTTILTLSQQTLKNVIKPAVNNDYILTHNMAATTTTMDANTIATEKGKLAGELPILETNLD